ncbi:15217_t:CDS:1, partial [Entrophospora sp. SA101]
PRIRSDVPLFTPEDYSYIMQCRDIKPRYKILNELMDKYRTSTKRIYQIWRGEESNRVLWDQPIPNLYDDDIDSNQNTNVLNSALNVLHIESQSLDRDKVPLLCKPLGDETGMSQRLEAQLPRDSVSSSNHSISQDPVQLIKLTKTKRSKSDRISNLSVIANDPIEKIDRRPLYSTDTLASFRCAVEEGKENLSNSKYKIDEL